MRIDKSFLRDRFLTIDIRTLGLARIYIALLLLVDLARRSLEMSTWYFESGLLPNSMLAEHPLRPWSYSLLFYVSSDTGVRLAFALIALVYLALLFGVCTRVAQVLAAICLISLQVRVDFLSNGGDFVFCNLLVWSAFLPLGSAFSFDAWRKKTRRPRQSPVVSWAVLVLTLQLAIIYFFNAVHKNGETWADGSAVYWLAQQERIVTWFGLWMRENLPLWVFRAMTYGSLVLEYLLPLLILSPWGRPWTRRAAIACIWSLHLGIAAVANVGSFSLVMIAYSMFLVSPADWAYLRGKLLARRGQGAWVVAALTLPEVDPATTPKQTPLHWLSNAFLAFLVVAAISQVLVENWAVPAFLKHEQPKWVQATIQTFRLNQGWSMFAPNAPRDDMWIVVDAVTSDGRHIDPYNELATRYADPTLQTVPPRLDMSYWWCDYTVRIPGFRQYHSSLTNWIFRYHERTGNENDRIVSFRASSVSQIPPAPGESEPRDVKVKAFLAKRQ
ncbi:MAG: HTTM domain-containing protein [Polyangiales bacterium]